MFLQRLDGIFRAGWGIPALGPDHGRDHPLVDPHQENKRETKYAKDLFH